MFISTNTGKCSHLANNCSQKVTSVPSDCNKSKPCKVKLVLLTFIISLFLSTAESRIPLQPFPRLGWGVIYHKQSQSCCLIACVMLFFQMVTLLILFCNRFFQGDSSSSSFAISMLLQLQEYTGPCLRHEHFSGTVAAVALHYMKIRQYF